ncbi:MAG: hypothetical protein AAF417_16675 [Pseudomonadota bacterium]
MTDRSPNQPRGRAKLVLLAAVFLAPLAAAVWLYLANPGLAPAGRTNAGTLLEPIVNLDSESGLHGVPALATDDVQGRWLLIFASETACDEACRNELYRMRQARLMLGNDMQRVVRVFLHGEIGPDTVWLSEQHAGLITISNKGLAAVLTRKRPANAGSGGLFLVDPLGNLVMHFAADLDPQDMVSDIEHLLELSRIG